MLVIPSEAGASLAKDPCDQSVSNRPGDPRKRAICRTARGEAEHLQAFRCLYESYRRSGLCRPCPSQVRILPFHLWDQTQTFIRVKEERVVGTVSLVLDAEDRHHLPSEHAFSADIDRERRSCHRLAEITSLAVATSDARTSSEIFVRLTSTAFHFARQYGVDRAIATVHPRHGRIYRRLVGCEQVGQIAPHGSVLGNPAALLVTLINDRERVSPPWRHWYFETRHEDWQLTPSVFDEDERRSLARYVKPHAAETAHRRAI